MISDIKIEQISRTVNSLVRNLAATGRGRKQVLSMAIDFTLAALSLWLAFSLRFNGTFVDFLNTWYLFLLVPALTVLTSIGFGVYRWMVRSSNLALYSQLAKTAVVSSIGLLLVVFLFPPDRIMPRSLFVIYGLLLMLNTSGVRVLWQGIFNATATGEPIAIYGAGSAGRRLAASLAASNDELRPVVFLDDDSALTDTVVAGIPIVDAKRDDLFTHIRHREVNKVIMAMPSISGAELESLVENFESAKFIVQTVPTMAEMMSGNHAAVEVRDVSISDVLGRNEVAPNQELMGFCVRGKSVMVTGGGGSIGSELCRQILALEPSSLIVVDNSEFNLYSITEDLNALNDASNEYSVFTPVLCSVLDEARIRELISEYDVETVYHAAAYKHVPIVEAQPEQGIRVNLFGTATVLEAAIDAKVEHFVLISTDKAVRPTNAMGASKRAAEMYLQAKAATKPHTRISMVRFGNVLGSSGSVVPKFTKQINAGGPITLTHPEITRYFMTIPEAAQLVLQASALSKGGDVFVLDMGEPILIEDLACRMVRLMGRELTRDTGNKADIEIAYVGIRPGEKLFEELFLGNEHRPTDIAKVFSTSEIFLPIEELELHLDELRRYETDSDRKSMRELLLRLSTLGYHEGEPVVDLPLQEQKSVSSTENNSNELISLN